MSFSLNPIVGIVEAVGSVVSDLVTTDKERMAADLAAYEAETARLATQTDTNKIEAASTSVFVSGWRPFVGWTCGFGLAYVSVIEPIGRFVAQVGFGYGGSFPVIDTELTLQVLLGMLGLAVARSYDKKAGTAK